MNNHESEISNKISVNDVAQILGKAAYDNSFNIDKQDAEENKKNKINGVVIGVISSIKENGKIFVNFHLNPLPRAIPAPTAADFNKDDVGREVALMFQNGDPELPFIIGPVIRNVNNNSPEAEELKADKKTITFTAEENIVLKSGKASITLTKAGKIIIRGKYILSRSSGVNSIKGGSVEIN